MSAPQTEKIGKRAVFFIGGYDPKSPTAFFDRIDREKSRFEALWDTEVEAGIVEPVSEDVTRVRFETKDVSGNKNWSTTTDFHFLSLDDIVLRDFEKTFLLRLWRYLVTYWDYVLSGTAYGFIKHAWRFSLYFFYPALLLTIAFLISIWLAGVIAVSGVALAWLAAPVIFLATFSAFVQLGGTRYHVLHLMDLWSFSRDFLRRNRQDIEVKLDRFADTMIEVAEAGQYDEVILIGHSTGGALILDAAGRAQEKNDAFASNAKYLTLLTVGSTALKIGLHPAAKWFRERLQKLFKNPQVSWVEYQCITDVINFHRTDPAELMKLDLTEPKRPIIQNIRIRKMISPETYQRIKSNFFRVHYQFVFGNTQTYHYDFLGICFGPCSLARRASNPGAFSNSLTGDEPVRK